MIFGAVFFVRWKAKDWTQRDCERHCFIIWIAVDSMKANATCTRTTHWLHRHSDWWGKKSEREFIFFFEAHTHTQILYGITHIGYQLHICKLHIQTGDRECLLLLLLLFFYFISSLSHCRRFPFPRWVESQRVCTVCMCHSAITNETKLDLKKKLIIPHIFVETSHTIRKTIYSVYFVDNSKEFREISEAIELAVYAI